MTNFNDKPNILPDWTKVLVNRQEFLKAIGLALGAVITFLSAIPAMAFAFNFLIVPHGKSWIKLGPVENFKEGETVLVHFDNPAILPWDGVSGHRSAWLRRIKGDQFIAFAVNCTHLGCPVRWEEKAKLLLCPCHGSVFDKNGDVAAARLHALCTATACVSIRVWSRSNLGPS